MGLFYEKPVLRLVCFLGGLSLLDSFIRYDVTELADVESVDVFDWPLELAEHTFYGGRWEGSWRSWLPSSLLALLDYLERLIYDVMEISNSHVILFGLEKQSHLDLWILYPSNFVGVTYPDSLSVQFLQNLLTNPAGNGHLFN